MRGMAWRATFAYPYHSGATAAGAGAAPPERGAPTGLRDGEM